MSILVVGSVALDSVETPFGKAEEVLGGSAVFFAAAASLLAPVQVVGVVGEDYPVGDLRASLNGQVDLSGVTTAPGESFRWSGIYSYDLNSRETLETRLGVFADFRPRIPEAFRSARFVFLGNIDPRLQMEVLDQVHSPELVVCDTMNFWIEGSRNALLELLGQVDFLLVNDSEARQLAGEPNLLQAARWIQDRGPRMVAIKKGEHGAILFVEDRVFFVPGYPLEEVFDPTGAGDAFAGGLMGYLASVGSMTLDDLRVATVFGSALGSFAVEDFSIRRFAGLTPEAIRRRVQEFREMTTFEYDLAGKPQG
jgi:sugar/nucleoside kinase (ribokinase family)